MELGGNELFIGLGVPLAVLFFVVIGQRTRIRRLEKEIDDVTLKFQVEAASPKEVRNELFTACPYPVCVVDTKGSILTRNPAFQKLTKTKVRSLAQFDQLARTTLATIPLHARRHSSKVITFPAPNGTLRHFTVLLWPVWGPHAQLGMVIAFHEQTKVLERKSNQQQFEHQLVTYLTLISGEIEQLITPAAAGLEVERQQALGALKGYAQELRLLFSHLDELHAELRQPNPHEVVNVAKLTNEVMKNHRSTLKSKSLQLISTLPREMLVLGHSKDLSLAIHSLTNAALLHAEKDHTIRLHSSREGRRVHLEFLLPDLQLAEKDIAQAFAFGATGKQVTSMMRFWRLQLSVARELVSKYNGDVSVQSHDEFGTTYRLSLVAAEKE